MNEGPCPLAVMEVTHEQFLGYLKYQYDLDFILLHDPHIEYVEEVLKGVGVL